MIGERLWSEVCISVNLNMIEQKTIKHHLKIKAFLDDPLYFQIEAEDCDAHCNGFSLSSGHKLRKEERIIINSISELVKN